MRVSLNNLPSAEVQRRITSSINIEVEENLCDEEPLSEEEVGEDADDDNLNVTMTVDDMEGFVGYSSGNGDFDWEF